MTEGCPVCRVALDSLECQVCLEGRARKVTLVSPGSLEHLEISESEACLAERVLLDCLDSRVTPAPLDSTARPERRETLDDLDNPATTECLE